MVPKREQILDAARRLSEASPDATFTPAQVVYALPDLNEGTVRNIVINQCCVNGPQPYVSHFGVLPPR